MPIVLGMVEQLLTKPVSNSDNKTWGMKS